MNKNEMINTIGIWALRLLLVAGAIYFGATGNDHLAGTLAMVALVSFLFF